MYDFLHQSETVLMEGNANKIRGYEKDMYVLDSDNQKAKSYWKIILPILAIIFFCGILGKVGKVDEDSKEPDFGITVDEYINNVKGYGVKNIEYVGKNEVNEGELVYTYKHGNRKIWVYTRENGNVYQVAYHDQEFIYGVGLVSDLIVNLSSEFLAATGVDESQSGLYSGIKQCVNGGSGSYIEYDDCTIHYADTILTYYETAWIVAK